MIVAVLEPEPERVPARGGAVPPELRGVRPRMMHTNAGQLTAGNTGLSERTAAILDANIEAAASAMARWQVAKYANMSAAAEPERQGRDRLARMIAPGATGAASHPGPTRRELAEREARRRTFLHTASQTLDRAERTAGTAQSDDPAGLPRQASTAAAARAAGMAEWGTLASPRVPRMLTTSTGELVYSDEPLERVSSSDDADDFEEEMHSSESSPAMFGEGERALYSLYMDAISRQSGSSQEGDDDTYEYGIPVGASEDAFALPRSMTTDGARTAEAEGKCSNGRLELYRRRL